MIIARVYEPIEKEILFHYCDASAFYSICNTKTLRLSDLFSMNDFLEIHWGYSIWQKVANEIHDKVGKQFLDEIDKVIYSAGTLGLLTSTCFSRNGDVLSQWRAYADDGNGYVIGFNAEDILKLPIRSLKVLYNEEEQVSELKNVILSLYDVEKDEKEKYSSEFKTACYTIACDLAAYKNPAFEEEQEIRIIHLLDFEKSNNFLKLVDYGGISFNNKSKGKPIKFRMRDNIPVAFIEEDFTDNGRINPIKEVIIGPKNNVLPSAISVFLETIEIGSVIIKKSKASYR